MAAVDFGDSELFDQFEEKAPAHNRLTDEGDDEEGESSDRLRELRQTLEVCEETIERLNAENILHPVSALAFSLISAEIYLTRLLNIVVLLNIAVCIIVLLIVFIRR